MKTTSLINKMGVCMRRVLIGGLAILPMAMAQTEGSRPEITPELEKMVTEAWHSGKTLPLETGRQFSPNLLNLREDKGYNILIDISHQCSFDYLWGLAPGLQRMGYRTVTSQASLDTVLDPMGHSRVRIPFDTKERIYPFAWYPNFKYNVIITQQSSTDAQKYTDKERKALVDFVNGGGSLIILASPSNDAEKMKAWSLNELARSFGAEFLPGSVNHEGQRYAALKLGEGWDILAKGDSDAPVKAQRSFGKGKVAVLGNTSALKEQKKGRENRSEPHPAADILAWACEGQAPVGGEPRLPQPMGGGGAIYPELESSAGDIVVYYAGNQKPELLKVVQETYPETTKKVLGWLPSLPTNEPMYLIISAGDGGGWAVNAFKPKENGVISASREGLISIYAHEFAHTIAGPPNDQGFLAGRPPIPEQGEEHAGWFQGKADAWFDEARRDKSNRNCNNAYESEKLRAFDLKRYQKDEEYRKGFNGGDVFAKTWYIWQKLDDRYGTTWYPRWKWVQHTRWANDKDRNLTWEEMVEDMSIAVGEDLFPFFNKVGIKLERDAAGELEFMGEKYKLQPSPIELSPAGPVRLEDIGDYKKPLKY